MSQQESFPFGPTPPPPPRGLKGVGKESFGPDVQQLAILAQSLERSFELQAKTAPEKKALLWRQLRMATAIAPASSGRLTKILDGMETDQRRFRKDVAEEAGMSPDLESRAHHLTNDHMTGFGEVTQALGKASKTARGDFSDALIEMATNDAQTSITSRAFPTVAANAEKLRQAKLLWDTTEALQGLSKECMGMHAHTALEEHFFTRLDAILKEYRAKGGQPQQVHGDLEEKFQALEQKVAKKKHIPLRDFGMDVEELRDYACAVSETWREDFIRGMQQDLPSAISLDHSAISQFGYAMAWGQIAGKLLGKHADQTRQLPDPHVAGDARSETVNRLMDGLSRGSGRQAGA